MNLISIGEVLWDVVEEVEHLGGAPLNFAANAAKLGHASFMVSAVGNDDRGRRALDRIAALGLSTEFIARTANYSTGHVTVALDHTGQPTFTIHRPAAYDNIDVSDSQLQRIQALNPDWIYFGTLAQTSAAVRVATERIISSASNAKRIYDVNLRQSSYDRDTVLALLSLASVVKLNEAEVPIVEDLIGREHQQSHESFCRYIAQRFGATAVCVTRGADGCELFLDGAYVASPACAIQVVDCIGAGDAFAAGLVHAISNGWEAQRAADFANCVGGVVASRAGAIPDWQISELQNVGDSINTEQNE